MATWTFSLNVTNTTDRELEVLFSQLSWGDWNTGNVEDQEPVSIPPNTTVEALGVKAAFGPSGYECSCTWKDRNVSPGSSDYGMLKIEIDVPYSGSNKAKCVANGRLFIDGWEDLQEDGHNFVRSIIITLKK